MTATSNCAFHFNVGPKTKRKTTTPSSHTHTVRRRRAERWGDENTRRAKTVGKTWL